VTEINSAPIRTVNYQTAKIDGLDLFYREAGTENRRTVVLLHGFPSSSHMYRNLIVALADKYRVIAPDLPGFGLSSSPDRSTFSYSFDAFAEVIGTLLDQLGISHYVLYVMDYGAPVGFRLALMHQTRVSALVVQNGNAYEKGLQAFWDPIRAYWVDPSVDHRDALRSLLTLDATRSQYVVGVSDLTRLDPAAWLLDQYFLDRPGIAEIQLDLFYDYRTNVSLYPRFQECLRYHQPPTLIMWGRNDPIFSVDGAHAFLRDLPNAQLHLLDTGHFALEDKLDEMVPLMRRFLAEEVWR
jgi:pimeloyl-ACP methyl ester carboxylesterase